MANERLKYSNTLKADLAWMTPAGFLTVDDLELWRVLSILTDAQKRLMQEMERRRRPG